MAESRGRFAGARRAARLLATGLLMWAGAALAADADERKSRAAPETEGPAALPALLGEADRTRYRDIFALQAGGHWRAADRAIAELESDLLLGHVLFQRYMHPTAYRSRFAELRDWLAAYRDHPGAWRVYRLAMRRRGSAPPPARPQPLRSPPAAESASRTQAAAPAPRRPTSVRRAIVAFEQRFSRELRRRRPGRAEKRYWAIERLGWLTPAEEADVLGRLADAYFFAGRDAKAAALGRIASQAAPTAAARGQWAGGLAAWRLGDAETAYALFAALSADGAQDGPHKAAAGVWAARAALVTGRPEAVAAHLRRAAAEPYSFYGLIALRQLGLAMPFDWEAPALSEADLAALLPLAAVRRAIALVSVGEDARADGELRYLLGRIAPRLRPALAALAARLGLPASQLHTALALGRKRAPASLHYPLPHWQPDGGFLVDRAVVFALIRQESKFLTRARSHAGARGLMQLMPATASYLTGDRSLRWRESPLYDPSFNMALGQRYLARLAERDAIRGNLFFLVAAYNAGPGNLARWRRRGDAGEDALLFMESIPLAETRDFVERVMANLWLYRLRMGQPEPSLDAVAAGAWPRYRRLDVAGPEDRMALSERIVGAEEADTR